MNRQAPQNKTAAAAALAAWPKHGAPPLCCNPSGNCPGNGADLELDAARTNTQRLVHVCRVCGHDHVTGLPASVTSTRKK
jgi:hypothetical protein